MLGKIALQKKLITKEQYDEAVQRCRDADNSQEALKEYFLSHNLISDKNMTQLVFTSNAIRIIQQTVKLGSIAVQMGFMDETTLAGVLDRQKQLVAENKLPDINGSHFVSSGALTEDQLRIVIQEQKKPLSGIKIPEPEKALKDLPSGPEKKTENLSVIIPGGILLEIEDNAMAAYLTRQESFSASVTVEDVMSVLISKNIISGIESETAIQEFLNASHVQEKRFLVASGIKPVEGSDARIEYYFETDYLKAGGLDDEGNIDFKDRGDIPKVPEGTLLAEKFDLIESKNGWNIYGEEQEVPPSKDVLLKFKTGCRLSEDGVKIYSNISGHPKLSWSGNISVLDTFTVKGDVNFETGHIVYNGNIEVKGCLRSGFKIEGNDIRIEEVDGGVIRAEGNVHILKGVNGAQIYSRGNVFAKFIHHTEIKCLGNIYIDSEVVDSTLENSGACLIEKGEIINSRIFSNQGVTVKNLGTEKTTPNIIKVGKDSFIAGEFKKIETAILEIETTISRFKKTNAQHTAENDNNTRQSTRLIFELDKARDYQSQIMNALADLNDQPEKARDIKSLTIELKKVRIQITRLDKELNTFFDRIESIDSKLLEIESTIPQLEDDIEDLNDEKLNLSEWTQSNPGHAVVKISGTVFPGTIIYGRYAQKEIREMMQSVEMKEIKSNQETAGGQYYEIYTHEKTNRR